MISELLFLLEVFAFSAVSTDQRTRDRRRRSDSLKHLCDSQKLQEIYNCSSLYPYRNMIEIKADIVHSSGKTNVIFAVPDDCDGGTLKDCIFEAKGIPNDRQTIIFKGQIIKDDKKLSEYGVETMKIMVLHRETPIPESDVVEEEVPILNIIKFILRTSTPQVNLMDRRFANLQNVYERLYRVLSEIKNLMLQLREVADGIVPNKFLVQLKEFDMESMRVDLSKLVEIVQEMDGELIELRVYLMQLNHLHRPLAPFLQYYANLKFRCDVPSNDEAINQRVHKVKEIIDNIVHFYMYSYFIVNNVKKQIQTRKYGLRAELVVDFLLPIQPDDNAFVERDLLYDILYDQIELPYDSDDSEEESPSNDDVYTQERIAEGSNENEPQIQVSDESDEGEAGANEPSSSTSNRKPKNNES